MLQRPESRRNFTVPELHKDIMSRLTTSPVYGAYESHNLQLMYARRDALVIDNSCLDDLGRLQKTHSWLSSLSISSERLLNGDTRTPGAPGYGCCVWGLRQQQDSRRRAHNSGQM
ncbi:hypothetical protein J6590_077568 [Homalodisca vitripennis]|nr:hypothetical protein J6590_077568 [Homalodisca vitripennis]